MQNDTWHRLIVTATVALLALMVMGGAIGGWLLGRDIPGWLMVLVGSIGTGAFVASGFFALTRSADQSMTALAESRANHHALAMAIATRTPIPTTEAVATAPAEETP